MLKKSLFLLVNFQNFVGLDVVKSAIKCRNSIVLLCSDVYFSDWQFRVSVLEE